MLAFTVRTTIRIVLATAATSVIVACGEMPDPNSLDHDGPPVSPAQETPSPERPKPSPHDHVIEQSTKQPEQVVEPKSDALPDTKCEGSCLPVKWLPDVLRGAGLDVWEDPDWSTHGHGSFENLWGIVAHHTGVDRDTEWMVVRDGRSDLPGPLSQLVLEKNGQYRVVASGVAWHAGKGSYSGLPDNNANWHTLGIEAVNTGLESWSAAQYKAYVRGVAAILKYLGLDATRVIGHKEWAGAAQKKWDPGGIDMDAFRADVQALITK